MRKATLAILAIILASTLVTGELHAATPKPDVGSGRVAWFDITTTSLPRSKDFYGKLFSRVARRCQKRASCSVPFHSHTRQDNASTRNSPRVPGRTATFCQSSGG